MGEGARRGWAVSVRGGGPSIGAARALPIGAPTPAAEGVLCLGHHRQQPPQRVQQHLHSESSSIRPSSHHAYCGPATMIQDPLDYQ
jgi:hypothetical protein